MRVIVLHTLASKRANEYERAREREKSHMQLTHTTSASQRACPTREFLRRYLCEVAANASTTIPIECAALRVHSKKSPPPPSGPLINRHIHTTIHTYKIYLDYY